MADTSFKLAVPVTESFRLSELPAIILFLLAALAMILLSSCGVTCLHSAFSVTPSISPMFLRIACSCVAVGYSRIAQTHL